MEHGNRTKDGEKLDKVREWEVPLVALPAAERGGGVPDDGVLVATNKTLFFFRLRDFRRVRVDRTPYDRLVGIRSNRPGRGLNEVASSSNCG